MGAGASARNKESPAAAATPAAEYTVTMLSPAADGKRILRVASEELVLLDTANTVLQRHPYFTIMCWGHSPDSFQFRIFGDESAAQGTTVVGTKQGATIEESVMNAVTTLMTDMQAKGITDEEFVMLTSLIGEDAERALEAARQASMSRSFDIKQALQVVRLIGEISPFDKLEAASMMYTRLINKSSFDLILNQFEDPADRENLKHRVGIRK